MDVYDFCYLCTDDSIEIEIYDTEGEDTVFHGTMREAQDSEWSGYEVMSFDLNFQDNYFCLNIDTSEDD